MSSDRHKSPISSEPIQALTGLRFFAALAVFVYHIEVFTRPDSGHYPVGPVAVSFFFILSGYILTRVYHDRLAIGPVWGKETRRFLITRIARLWPLHVLCLGFVIAFGGWIHISDHWGEKNSLASLAANLFMVHSWVPIDSWFLGFNAVSWSIATELFFYLCFPVFFAARKHIVLVFLSMLALTLLIQRWLEDWNESPLRPEWFSLGSMVMANPLGFLWQFCLGMVIAMPASENPAGPIGEKRRNVLFDTTIETISLLSIPLIIYAIANDPSALGRLFHFARFDPTSWLRFALVVPAFAVVIYVFGRSSGLWSRLFGCRLLVWLGETSFGFYMIHQIVLMMLEPRPIDNATWIAGSFLITVFAAGIVFRLIEVPCKQAILSAWDLRWSAMPGNLNSGFRSRGLPFLLFNVAALAGVLLVLFTRMPTAVLPETTLAIRDNQLQNGTVVFQDQAHLNACRVCSVQGSLHIELVWAKLRSHRLNRFVNLHKANGAFLRSVVVAQKPFRKALPRQMFLDRIELPPGTWEDAASVSIGFWDRQKGASVRVAGGPGGENANAFRIDLESWKPQEIADGPGENESSPNRRPSFF